MGWDHATSRVRAVRLGAVASVVLALVLAGPAAAQDSRELKALTQKIDRLQGELNDLQRKVYSGEAPEETGDSGGTDGDEAASGTGDMGPAAARRLAQRLDALEGDIRRLTGQLQETRRELEQTAKRVDKLAKDVDYRLSKLESFRKQAAAKLDALTEGDGTTAEVASAEGDAGQTQTENAGSDNRPGPDSDQRAEASGNADPGDGRSDDQPRVIGTVSQSAVEDVREDAENAGDDRRTGEADAAADGDGGAGASAQDASSNMGSGDEPGETQTAAKPSGENVLPDGDAGEQYDYAFKLLRERDYAKAEKAMRAFVEAHPEHELAGNAKYWLGETYYVREQYNKAAVAFSEAFRSYPDSRKAPDNLLKLGITLAKIDKVDKACRLFSELEKRFPDAPQNIQHRAEREQKRLDCGNAG